MEGSPKNKEPTSTGRGGICYTMLSIGSCSRREEEEKKQRGEVLQEKKNDTRGRRKDN